VSVRRTTTRDRLAFAVRRDGVPSAVAAAAIVGFAAGMLDATGHEEPLLAYTLTWLALTVVVLVLRRRWLRFRVMLTLLRPFATRQRHTPGAGPPPVEMRSASGAPRQDRQTPAVRALLGLTSTPDPFLLGSFGSLVHPGLSPLIVTACNPRDIGRSENLLHPILAAQWDGEPVTVDLRPAGPEVRLIRQLPRGNDQEHTMASRDICYLADLGAELLALAGDVRAHCPLVMPEHCVDTELLAKHDLVLVSGPDTNFWHAALFEAVATGFDAPPSTLALPMSLRDMTSGGVAVYGSSDLFVRLRGASLATGREADGDSVRLSETARPTYGAVMATTNPLSSAADPHWCLFAAGLRSLGTMAATLVVTSLLRAMRRNGRNDFWSLAPVLDVVGAYAPVAAALVRGERRATLAVPHDRPDPAYRDSYVVMTAEILDTTGPTAEWRTVTLDAFPALAGRTA
jgi:hypothetical protein